MKNKLEPLSSVADLHTVQVFRDSSPEIDIEGNAYSISIRDLVGSWPLSVNELTKIFLTSEEKQHCVKNEDILMPARGDRYPARVIQEEEKNIIPVGHVTVIRSTARINPNYLAWYLNRNETQQELAKLLTGTNIKSLNKSKLMSVPIYVPGRHVQESISKIQKLYFQKIILQKKLAILEKIEVEAVCENIFSKKEEFHG
ncbi:restriction endonuclease subunit S [Janthinobacterium lividum]